jgi:hypothetical protein
VHAELPPGCMQFPFTKLFITIFGLGLMEGENFGNIVGGIYFNLYHVFAIEK